MAFTTKTKQSVEIDGVSYIPEITTELRMRLGNINFDTEENTQEAYSVISECFPGKQSKIKSLLPKIPVLDLQFMRAYLLGGETAVKVVEQELARAMRSENV